MAPRVSSKPAPGSYAFQPANDGTTYRDLLLFEERLKTNAASLRRRKHRYQLFLAQLLLAIAFLLSEVLLHTRFLLIPYRILLRNVLPDVQTDHLDAVLHMYFASGLLFVSLTTLVLFFATGMYSEKIGYANRYVPHANRALRNFNMYLNVRRPPLRSKIPFNPLAFLFPRPPTRPPSASASASASPSPPPSRTSRSPSPSRSTSKRSASAPIPPIPPAANPRGELIFSSRVDRAFRESYERYRAAFERRREERERAAYAARWLGWLRLRLPWTRRVPPPPSGSPGAATPMAQAISRSGSASLRGRASGSAGSTPEGSRRSSPVPGRTKRRGSVTAATATARGGTPPSQHPLASEPLSESEDKLNV